MITETKSAPMTLREKMIFASGDLFGGGAQVVIAFFYLRFLTDVVKISPLLAGTVVLVCKVWDAVSDPIMGTITDNTRSRFGRRRPYMLLGFFLIIIAFTLLWYAPGLQSQGAKFSFVIFSYLFFSTVTTIVMVPYAAFSSEISQNVKERDWVNGSRLLFSQVSSLLGAVLPMMIVGLFAERFGYVVMGLVFGLFYALPYLAIFFMCQERTPIPAEKSRFSLRHIVSPIKIRAYRSLIIIYLLAFFVMDVVSAAFSYYMTYFIGRGDLLELVLGTMLIVQIVALPGTIMLSERIGKAQTFIVGAVIFGLGAFALGFYDTSWHIASIFVISGVVGLGLIACIVMPWVMFPDVTDISQLAFGERRSGAFAGLMTFMRKFSSAIGIWVVGLMLQFSGYILPGDVIVPASASVVIEQPGEITVDLDKDGAPDLLINMARQHVSLPAGEPPFSLAFDQGILKGFVDSPHGEALVLVIEPGLELSQAWDFAPDSAVKSVKTLSQPESLITGLKLIVFFLPGTLLLIAIVVAARFPLTRQSHQLLLKHYQDGIGPDELSKLKLQLI